MKTVEQLLEEYFASELFAYRKKRIDDILQSANEPLFDTWIQTNDFWVAPASTNRHLHVIGGLTQHIINVFDVIPKWLGKHRKAARLALFHDVCKIDHYIPRVITKKEYYTEEEMIERIENHEGKGKPRKTYDVFKMGYQGQDEFPIGHGGKSVVMLLQLGIILSDEELVAIWWHMGDRDEYYQYPMMETKIFENHYDIVRVLQRADQDATFQEDHISH